MSVFGDVLRGHRLARSFTQEELAARAGITPKAVGALERGERRRPFAHTVRALADALTLDDGDRAALVAAANGTPDPDPRYAPAAVRRPPAPVIGRDDQIDTVANLLRRRACRILTLTGPGGVGKTTLALAATAAVQPQFCAGVLLVELADIASPDDVVPAIATALGVPETRTADRTAAVVAAIGDRELLLLLDNIEHVLGCAADVAVIVASCPALMVLATGRARLRLRAEREVRVAPLNLDTAVHLFLERLTAAGSAVPDDAPTAAAVAALCARADGLPLAIELMASAASRVGPDALLAHVAVLPDVAPRDLPVRQRSIATTFAWSVQLLTDPARRLLGRLAVCVGGFTLADAVEIGEVAYGDLLATIAELVEHSLVIRTGAEAGRERFRLLEPVRQHAAELLDTDAVRAARDGLCQAMLGVARSLAGDLQGAGQIAALHTLEAGIGNLHEAMRHLLAENRNGEAAELLWLVWLHHAIRGHARAAGAWAAALASRQLDRRSRIRVLVAWAGLEHLAHPGHGLRLAREALDMASADGDEDLLAAQAATLAASTAFFSDDLAPALELIDVALRRTRAVGDPFLITHTAIARGQIALLTDDPDAFDVTREAEEAARACGSAFEIGAALTLRATAAERLGLIEEAARMLVEALELAAATGNRWTPAYMLSALAGIAVRLGDVESGARLFGAWSSYADRHEVVKDFPTTLAQVERDVSRARLELGGADFENAWRSGRQTRLDEVVALARTIARRPG
jgi:predicted ATPase/DNA-binding XRE family transcriptional regulator